ncbi:Hypothetical protein GL50581_2769 [Giardia duodenalis ATCC 50581]|uniref:Uncharacterized protein n=1 Tax=Giardia intestinalis (strain ATCC 50581 / GS clone H7) TaxID=598745 RepID=C6LVG3_GIAIB|nr:Hypothetical protein GL50581_2769 [Giardia intestinalis ATCC 50581]
MQARSLKPPKSALSHVQQALYALYDTDVLEKAVFYFPRPSLENETSYDYIFAVILLYHTARKMMGIFSLCLIGSAEMTSHLGQAFDITICSSLNELSEHFSDKKIFLEVDWARNSVLGRRWFTEIFSPTTIAGPMRNGALYIYLCTADTQLNSLQGTIDLGSLLAGHIDETYTTLQPPRKCAIEKSDDMSRVMSYLTSSLEVNPHTLRNITSAFTALLRGRRLREVKHTKASFSLEYFTSASIQTKLVSIKITFRNAEGEELQRPFSPSPSILYAIAAFMAEESRVRSLRRVAVAFSGGKDSLCLLLHLSLLSLMARRGMLDPIGLSDMRMLEVTPVTFDPKIPGFILDTIRGLCPRSLSIDSNEGGTMKLEQQTVEMDVAAKIARLETNRLGQETKKTSACSVCSRCRRGSLANFVSINGYDALALGHHLLDDLETMVITGVHGASFFGLRGCYSGEVKDTNGAVRRVCILRPMLSVHVHEISQVVLKNDLSCVASDAAECSIAISRTAGPSPPGERLRARKLLSSVDLSGACAFKDRYGHMMAPFTGELD